MEKTATQQDIIEETTQQSVDLDVNKEIEKKHPGGRPTKYGDHILEKALEYHYSFRLPLEERTELLGDEEVVPTKEGLSLYLGIAYDTLFEWCSQDDKKEFSDIVGMIFTNQAKTLANKSLKGEFNSNISKLLLSKHGYHDKVDTNTNMIANITYGWENQENNNTIQTEELGNEVTSIT